MIRFINGYIVTTESDDAPSRILAVDSEICGCTKMKDHVYLYQFNWVKTANPALSCIPRNPTAWGIVTSPFAIGRVLVLSTARIQVQSPIITKRRAPHARSFGVRLTDTLVQIPIPHIIDRAPRTPHDERANSKESQIRQGSGYREIERIRSHRYRPSCLFRHDSKIPVLGGGDVPHG